MTIEDVDSIITQDDNDERKAFDEISDKVKEEGDDKGKDKTGKGKDKEDEEELKEEDKEGPEKEEEDIEKEDEELEKEEEEEKEEEIDETTYQQLKKVDKDIFKKVPELRSVIFREQEYTKVFPSVEDAKQAQEAAEIFAGYQNDLTEGNSGPLLEALEKVDKKSLESFVANFIPTVEKQSKDLYLGMLYPEFKKLFRAAIKSGDDRLVKSAENLNWFIFGDTDVRSDVGLKPKQRDERDEEFSKKEREFEERQYNSFRSDVVKTGESRTKAIIRSAFKDSDMSELLQKSLTNEIFTRVAGIITKDARHMGNVNNLWQQAKRAGFTSEWKDRILSAYLSRAKLLIPKYRQQVLSEAKVSAKTRSEETNEKKPIRVSPSHSVHHKVQGKLDPKKINWDKTDERALLDGNYVEKK